ncbi:MAG: hypothetical protein K2W85_11410 [Phycisphaerales bacterium]|nr:hypothetical protein [Phycisphaerales bacterium]
MLTTNLLDHPAQAGLRIASTSRITAISGVTALTKDHSKSVRRSAFSIMLALNISCAIMFVVLGFMDNLGYGMVYATQISQSNDSARVREYIQRVHSESGQLLLWAAGLLVLNSIALVGFARTRQPPQ